MRGPNGVSFREQPCGPLRLETVFDIAECGGAPQGCSRKDTGTVCAKGVEIFKEAGGEAGEGSWLPPIDPRWWRLIFV